jgi:hypothetical protein
MASANHIDPARNTVFNLRSSGRPPPFDSRRCGNGISQSLAQEENADQRLSQIARSLMSAAKMPAAVE